MEDKIYLGSDHAGFRLKARLVAWLRKSGFNPIDMGPFSYDKDDDYPEYAALVSRAVIRGKNKARGILICGSGQGMDRAANKINGIHASVCWDEKSALIAKTHGNVNVLCLGESFVTLALAKKIVGIWINVPFSMEERHVRRIAKIRRLERKH